MARQIKYLCKGRGVAKILQQISFLQRVSFVSENKTVKLRLKALNREFFFNDADALLQLLIRANETEISRPK